MILAVFDPQFALIRPTNFQSIGLLVQEKKFKTDFQDGNHGSNLGFKIQAIFATFDNNIKVTSILPNKFQVSWPLLSAEKVQNTFSRWLQRLPCRISNGNSFSYFYLKVDHTDTSYQVSSRTVGLLGQEKKFKILAMANILDF